MIQGTASHVGKSFVAAGLCRLFKQEGVSVAPFKSQNMALNSFATADGLEIGRAQAVQAMAAGLAPAVEMNPVLLKPTSDRKAQVVVLGKAMGDMDAVSYHRKKTDMLAVIKASLDKLRQRYELVIIEGAGSPAEINLADRDIANMAVAGLADSPVVLVADIDRGGAFASICGTLELLPAADIDRIAGFIINKFRGDPSLLDSGIDFLQKKTGLPVLGVIPFSSVRLEDEDSVGLENRSARHEGEIRIAVPFLPRISNFTDLQPLEQTAGVRVDFVDDRTALGLPDAIILPGSKNTIGDLLWLKETGLADAVIALAGEGVPILGFCGGFQMLGCMLSDRLGVETEAGTETEGLGLLPVVSEFEPEKTVRQISATPAGLERIIGRIAGDGRIDGYEIHAGTSTAVGPGQPFARLLDGRPDGWVSDSLPVAGTYIHGLFDNDQVRKGFLEALARKRGLSLDVGEIESFDQRIDKVAELLRAALDIPAIFKLAGLRAQEKVGVDAV